MFACIRSFAALQRPPLAPLSRGIYAGRVLAEDKTKQPPTDATESKQSKAPEESDDADVDIQSEVLGAEPIKAFMPKEEDGGEDGEDGPGRKGRRKKKSEKESEKEDEGGAKRWRGYKGWMIVESGKYKKMKPHETMYLGGGGRFPFPLNPYFQPRAPVSNEVKEALYKDYLADPVRSTPRLLAEKYRVSIKRAEAIIKLKAIEKHMVSTKEITEQKNLTAGMESMLGVKSKSAVMETLISNRTSVSGPRFHAVPEGVQFGPTEAAEVLGRQPYQQIVDRLAASTPYIVDYEGLDEAFAPRPQKKLSESEKKRLAGLGSATDTFIEKNEALTNQRWKFVFTDVSKNKDMKDRFVLIREKDGTLKQANRDYKLKRYGAMWYN